MNTSHKIVLLLVFSAFYSCGNTNNDIAENASESAGYCIDETFKKSLVIEQPIKKKITEDISLTGSVETNPDKVIHFVSLVGGIISKTYFSLGDTVKKGQVLAEIRSTELSALDAEFQSLNSQIKVAEVKLLSVERMFKDEISSQKELIEAQTELAILKSERQKVASNLNIFSASSGKDVFLIKAPKTGIITDTSIATGTQISAEGAPLFTISDLSEIWVLVNVYATNIESIQAGIEVNISSLSYPDEIFKGTIKTISQVLDNEAKVLKARVVLNNEDLKLKPGMLVDVVAEKKFDSDGISISTDAMVFDQNQNFVVVYKTDCDVEIRKVELLNSNKKETFLISGLQENEKIISKKQLLIYEQLKNFQN